MKIRTGMYTDFGTRLRAANGESKMAPTKPRIVATKAIFMVSNMPMKALEQKNPMLDSHAGYFLA
jgi:hypothetical protein